jgi:hypothetical protein
MRKGMKRLATAAFFASILVLGQSPTYSQRTTQNGQAYELSNSEFSVMMPGKPEHLRSISRLSPAYDGYRVTANGVYFLVLVRETKSKYSKYEYEHKVLLLKGHSIGYNAGFIQEHKKSGVNVDITFDRDLNLNGFPGRQYRIVSEKESGILRFYATDRYIYTLQVLGSTEGDDTVRKFFDSLKLKRR